MLCSSPLCGSRIKVKTGKIQRGKQANIWFLGLIVAPPTWEPVRSNIRDDEPRLVHAFIRVSHRDLALTVLNTTDCASPEGGSIQERFGFQTLNLAN